MKFRSTLVYADLVVVVGNLGFPQTVENVYYLVDSAVLGGGKEQPCVDFVRVVEHNIDVIPFADFLSNGEERFVVEIEFVVMPGRVPLCVHMGYMERVAHEMGIFTRHNAADGLGSAYLYATFHEGDMGVGRCIGSYVELSAQNTGCRMCCLYDEWMSGIMCYLEIGFALKLYFARIAGKMVGVGQAAIGI